MERWHGELDFYALRRWRSGSEWSAVPAIEELIRAGAVRVELRMAAHRHRKVRVPQLSDERWPQCGDRGRHKLVPEMRLMLAAKFPFGALAGGLNRLLVRIREQGFAWDAEDPLFTQSWWVRDEQNDLGLVPLRFFYPVPGELTDVAKDGNLDLLMKILPIRTVLALEASRAERGWYAVTFHFSREHADQFRARLMRDAPGTLQFV